MNSHRLHRRYGPWAVITGASEGIGRAFAQALAGAGFSLVLVARRTEQLNQLAQSLGQSHGVTCLVVTADLKEPAAVEHILEITQPLDVGLLVAAAGFGTSGYFHNTVIADELAMVDVNCRSVVALTHAFALRFMQKKRGGIVLFSSIVAFQGVAHAATYAATKAFIQTFAEGLHLEMKPYGVDVLAVAPGPVHSGFGKRARMDISAKAEKPETVAEGALRALGRRLTTRPGFLAKFLALSLKPLPRFGRIHVMSLVMQGMTKHHAQPASPIR